MDELEQGAQTGEAGQTPEMPRVAAVVTTYYPRSHADVIVSKLLADYTHPAPRDVARYDFHKAARNLTEAPLPTDEQGWLKRPRVRVVSLYTDQVPANDISREWSARSGVPIYGTVREALTLGGDRLAVDGVVIVGEHGDYPHNERGQHLYPRRELFEQAIDVIREAGRPVPIFVDKHLSYSWANARWMVDTARALGVPLMAGSSVPTTPISWRRPQVQLPLGSRVHRTLVAAGPPLEAYGFHALEALQCVVERRAGGESGVAAVQCLTGEAMWQAGRQGRWDESLLEGALAVSERRAPGDPRQLAKEPAVFLLEYRDGLRAAVCILGGVTGQRAVAADVTPPGSTAPERLAFRFGEGGQEPYAHFAWQVEKIQDLICSGREPQPVERTLLTTGVLDRAMESHWRGGVRLETPELAVTYRVDSDEV
jgi:hypothetical protein